MKKIINNILLFIFIVMLLMSCQMNAKEVNLKLPNLEDIVYVELRSGDYFTVLFEKDDVKELISLFSDVSNTDIDSVSESPNVPYISINIVMNEKAERYLMYKGYDKYYLEAPYNGVWEISEESFNNINSRFDDLENKSVHNSKAKNEFLEFYDDNVDKGIYGDKLIEFVNLAYKLSYEDAISLGFTNCYFDDKGVSYYNEGIGFSFDSKDKELSIFTLNKNFSGAYIGKSKQDLTNDFGEPKFSSKSSDTYEIDDKLYTFNYGKKYYDEDIITSFYVWK